MSDRFNISRFLKYAQMHYCSNMWVYILVSIAIFFFSILICADWQINPKILYPQYNGSGSVKSDFSGAFVVASVIYIVSFIRLSMRGFRGSFVSISDVMIPVSTLERYIFTLLNSAVVPLVIFSLIFTVGSSYVESLYLFDDSGNYIYRGLLGQIPDSMLPENIADFHKVELFKLFEQGDIFVKTYNSTILLQGSMISVYLLAVSMIMWGELTFRKSAVSIVLTILLHGLAIGLSIFIIYKFNENLPNVYMPNVIVWFDRTTTYNNLYHLALSLPIISTVVYQWVVWKKMKNVSL